MARSPKALAIESALRHQGTRQTFLDAFNAPIGSTKRKNASTMLKGMSLAARRRFSGQGGPDSIRDKNPWSRFKLPASSMRHPLKRAPKITSFDGRGGISLGSTPLTWGNKVSSPWDTSWTAGSASFTVPTYDRTVSKPPVTQTTPTSTTPASQWQLDMKDILTPTYDKTVEDRKTAVNKLFSGTSDAAGTGVSFLTSPEARALFAPASQTPSTTQSGKSEASSPAGMKPGDIRVNDAAGTYIYINNDGTTHEGKLGDNYVDPTSISVSGSVSTRTSTGESVYGPPEVSGVSEVPGVTDADVSAGTFGSASLTGWDRIRDLVQGKMTGGLGPQASAIAIMNDPDAMAELQKLFPGIPQELLPKGAILSNQLYDLAALKREEMGLNEMQARMKNLVSEGVNLQSDLTDFVRGKDEYITKIDGLLDKAQTSILGRADAADPRVKNEYNSYVNYLTTLKGRQTKRYTDVLNDSIDQHNKDLERLDGLYQTTLTQYNEEVEKESTISQEVYTQMYNSLTELYTQLSTASSSEYDAEMKMNELAKSRLDVASAALKLQSDQADSGSMEKGVAYAKNAGFINPDTGSVMGVDILSGVSDLMANGYDIPAARGFVSSVLNAASSELTAPRDEKTSTESGLDKINRINQAIGNLKSFAAGDFSGVATGLETNADAFSQLTDIFQQYLPTIQKNEEMILVNELSTNSKAIRQALLELLGKKGGFLGFGGKKATEFNEWRNSKAAQSLPPTVLKMIETLNGVADANGASLTEVLGISDIESASDSELSRAISNAYISTLF